LTQGGEKVGGIKVSFRAYAEEAKGLKVGGREDKGCLTSPKKRSREGKPEEMRGKLEGGRAEKGRKK